MEKLDVKAAALSLGALFGIYVLFLGWAAIFGWGVGIVELMSSLYIGFAPTFLGGIIGAVWGFIDGAIAGLIIAFVYNSVACKKCEVQEKVPEKKPVKKPLKKKK